MLGKIIEIVDNSIVLEINQEQKNVSLINRYVVIDDDTHKFVGEIASVNLEKIVINLLGEVVNQKFVFGVLSKPSSSSQVYLLTEEAVSILFGMNPSNNEELYIGNSPIYNQVKIGANINQLFSNHFAVLGSSGSGKSSGFARILQNLFYNQNSTAYYANFFIFDAYGEYHNAFRDISKINPNLNFKSYSTDLMGAEGEILRLPIWLLGVDDLALLLGVEKHSQLPIIEKALKLVNVFVRPEEEVMKYKNDIIARAILDILSSGKSSSQIRDQIFSVLSTYHTKELNLDTMIIQPGYNRTLKQCLLIDNNGKIREMELIIEFIQKYLNDSIELSLPNGSIYYTLEDLEQALDFSLISEGILKSDKVYDDSNIIRVRLHSLIQSNSSQFFRYSNFISKEDYIKTLLFNGSGKKVQIVNFNINYIDDNLAKAITKIYSKLLFDYAKSLPSRASVAFHIVLEEAHRYVQNDRDIFLIGYNIFDRIAKEGRKYGVLLGLISQRPCELSNTSLSQCSNFLIFKTMFPDDIEYIYKMIPNINHDIISQFKILPPGNCVVFGTAFKLPIMVHLEMPNPAPSNSSCDIRKVWFINN